MSGGGVGKLDDVFRSRSAIEVFTSDDEEKVGPLGILSYLLELPHPELAEVLLGMGAGLPRCPRSHELGHFRP